jgi:IS5 family transposase
MDSSHVRNRHGRKPNTGRNHVDRGRQGTKISVVTDDARIVYGMHLAPSNRPDVVLLDQTLDSRWLKLEGIELWADRGYDSRANRERCADRNMKDRIFRRRTKTTRKSNAKRVIVEHVFAHLQSMRRLSFCYEQRTEIFRQFFILAFGHRIGQALSRVQREQCSRDSGV